VGDKVLDIFVHVWPKIPEADFVEYVIYIVVVADCLCVKSRENNISEAQWYDLELDIVPNNVDCLTDIKDAVDVVDLTVTKRLSVDKMDCFQGGLFYCRWVGEHFNEGFCVFVSFVCGLPRFDCGES
jgi:hypothetical protein